MSKNHIEHTATLLMRGDRFELEFQTPRLLNSIVQKMFSDQEQVIVSITRIDKTRSNKQNRYYWGVVVPYVREFMQETQGSDYTPDDVHAYHTTVVVGLKPELRRVNGEEVYVFKAVKTSEMTIAQFKQFIQQIQAHWAERGLNIPDPTEDATKEYYNENIKKYTDD